jgi:thiamine pyrophosphate-dependent acetolactate synthase large subunit-like protein
VGKLVADIIVETLQNAGVKHCYGVVGDTLNLIARSLVEALLCLTEAQPPGGVEV